MAHQRLAGITSPSFSFQVGSTVLPEGEAAGPITMGDPPSLLRSPPCPFIWWGCTCSLEKALHTPSILQSPGMLVHVREAPSHPTLKSSISLQALEVQVPKPPLQTLGRRLSWGCSAAEL